MGKIFISYARADCEGARRLYDDLRARGLKAWLDTEDLLPGMRWRDAIDKAIHADHVTDPAKDILREIKRTDRLWRL